MKKRIVYFTKSTRVRKFKRALLLDGILIEINHNGRDGEITTSVELSATAQERVSKFLGVRIMDAPPVAEVAETPVADESVETLVDAGTAVEQVADEGGAEETAEAEDSMVADTVEEDGEVEEDGDSEETVDAPVDVEEVPEEEEEEEEEETIEGVTKAQVQEAYEAEGTWAGVRRRLDLTDYRLKKIREGFGL